MAGIKTAEELGAVLAELTRRKVPLPRNVTVTGLINSLPGPERDKATQIAREYDFTVTGGGKLEPFGYQWKPRNVIDAYDLDPKAADFVHTKMVEETITAGLQERLGTDQQLPPEEPDRRSDVAAAFDLHTSGQEQ